MRIAEMRLATGTGKHRRAGLKAGARDKEPGNPFHKLRGAGAQRIEVDRNLASIRGR